jgi:hypothetical protein
MRGWLDMAEGRRVKVVRVATTPQDGAWLLELSCGHRLVVTAAAEPVRDDATCLECEKSIDVQRRVVV